MERFFSEVVYPRRVHHFLCAKKWLKNPLNEKSFRHINSGLEQSISLMEIQPVYKTQQDNFDLVLQCWLNLLYLLLNLGLSYQVGRIVDRPDRSEILSAAKQTFLLVLSISHPTVPGEMRS